MLSSYNPATGEIVGTVSPTQVSEVSAVVAAAHVAQPSWDALGLAGRAASIEGAGPLFIERAEELGSLLTAEMGKPLREAVGEVKSCGTGLAEDLASMAAALAPEFLEDARTRTELVHVPFGVAAAITPWNFPISMCHWMVVPALMAGNAVVLKPSELTPLIAQAYVDVMNEVLPPGVLQIIHGDETQGRALVEDDVQLVAFTGSRAAGAQIMASAAPKLKRILLELGGKDPLIVLDDADVAAAARHAARGSFRNAGQVCVSTERIYVHRAVADEFERLLVEQVPSFVVGNGADPGTVVGPMITEAQADHVRRQVAAALDSGAQVLAGGDMGKGTFVHPTVLGALDHSMDIMRTETFGPIACVVRVDDNEQAIRLANDSIYALGAVVFGRDEQRASKVAHRLHAGMTGINRGVGGASGSPWVGARESGYGYHGGKAGQRQFAQARIVSRSRRD